MKAARQKTASALSSTAAVLLDELCAECEQVVHLIHRLESAPMSQHEREDILGELSAGGFHLHTDPAGLDEFLCETE